MTRNNESDVIELSPQEQIACDIDETIKFWVHSGLRTPRDYRTPKVYGEAKKQLRAILTGKHPHVPRLNKTQIVCSIANFKCAATDPRFRPVKKQLLKKLSINEFIWEPYTKKSHLLIYTEPPKTIEAHIDPKLTMELYRQYCLTKWGKTDDTTDVPVTLLSIFVRISNRLIKYLREVEDRLQPLMGVSSKTPTRAAYGLMQSNLVDRPDFNPLWLANDISIGNLERWLKNQGFFKHSTKAV
jgi:hypothetical protein